MGIVPCKGWFPLTRFWLRTVTHENFNHVNKVEARYKVLRLNVKLSEVLFLCSHATFHTLPLSFLFANGNFTHVKITRQLKSTLTSTLVRRHAHWNRHTLKNPWPPHFLNEIFCQTIWFVFFIFAYWLKLQGGKWVFVNRRSLELF